MQTTFMRRHVLIWTLLIIGALVIGASHGGLAALAAAAIIVFILL
jgi:hypothetical protein